MSGRAYGLEKTEWRGAGTVICQLLQLPLTASCSRKIQTGLIFLIPTHLGSPGQRAVKWTLCVGCNTLYKKNRKTTHLDNTAEQNDIHHQHLDRTSWLTSESHHRHFHTSHQSHQPLHTQHTWTNHIMIYGTLQHDTRGPITSYGAITSRHTCTNHTQHT